MKITDSLYKTQTLHLSQSAASEAIAEAFNTLDWKNESIAELSREILRRMGFKVTQ